MSKTKRTLQELTIKDNFMFAAVMLDEENCRHLLELILNIPIARVDVSAEKSIVYNPEYKGIRLDVIAKDEKNTHYDVEMQVRGTDNLPRRMRYYHSQMDMELLLSGTEYEKLPESFVIFICDFDPFGGKKYCYTVESRLKEMEGYPYEDGNHSIYLSTQGKNKDEVPKSLVRFLEFVHANLEDSTGDFKDEYVERLQKAIAKIKASREMGARYMVFQEMLKEEYAEGKKDGKSEGIAEGKTEDLLEVLRELGEIPGDLADQITGIKDVEILNRLFKAAIKAAIKADSLDCFLKEMDAICPQN